jgi:mono/diheme cytochrome c family protein
MRRIWFILSPVNAFRGAYNDAFDWKLAPVERRNMHKTAIGGGVLVVAMLTAFWVTATAQAPATVLDGVYTAAQAERGDAAFGASCAGCHEGQDADGPLLVGRAFLDRWREDRLEALFTFMKTRMPGNLPGSLEDRAYADITAHILKENGLPAGQRELRADMVSGIQLVGADGPQPLANLTIVRAVGCLGSEADKTWALSKVDRMTPVRTRNVEGTTTEDRTRAAAQPPGSQTFRLTSVALSSAAYSGHKVLVTGVLTRQGQVERINVMAIDSVGSSCG